MQPLTSYPTRQLSEFLASFTLADVPAEAIEKTKELFLDWVGSALAGKDSGPVRALETFAKQMGPLSGPSEVLSSLTTPSFSPPAPRARLRPRPPPPNSSA